MTTEKNAKRTAGILTGLLILTLASSFYYYNNSREYKTEADRARLAQDSALAVKQLLDKELQDMKLALQSAKGYNAELNKKLEASESLVRDKQTQIDRLIAAHASVSALHKQLKQLKAERAAMEKRIQDLLDENQKLQAENAGLKQAVARLESDRLALQDKLNAADAAGGKAGDFRIDMMRNSTRVTAKARRTEEIGVSFDLPANLSSETSGTKEVYLVVLDPGGKPIRHKSSKTISLRTAEPSLT